MQLGLHVGRDSIDLQTQISSKDLAADGFAASGLIYPSTLLANTMPTSGAGSYSSSAERPLPAAAAEFDLSLEAIEERHDQRVNQGPFVAIYAGAGAVFAIWGALGLLGFNVGFNGAGALAMVLIGGTIAVLGAYAIRWFGSNSAVQLRVDDSGLTFRRKNGKVVQLRWADPRLKFNLSHLAGDPNRVFGKSDARYARPYWVDVWTSASRYYKLETTLPREASEAIQERAREQGVGVSILRVAFYWHSAPKSPGWLDWDPEGKVGEGRTLNGVITKFRGPQAAPDSR